MNHPKNIYRQPEIYLPLLLLGMLSFSFFFFLFDYVFFYQEKSGLFLSSSTYLFSHLMRPGGMLMYLSEFLTALYYFHRQVQSFWQPY
jgi:hypothetical protein